MKIEVRELRRGRKSFQVVTVVMFINHMELALNSLMIIYHLSFTQSCILSLCWLQSIIWDQYKSTHKQRLGVNVRSKKQKSV